MSISLEILPTKSLPADWQDSLCEKIASEKDAVHLDDRLFLMWNQLPMFNIWLAKKEPAVFPDESYIEGFRNLDKIDVDQFLEKFKQVPYSIQLDSGAARQEGELGLMVHAAAILAEMTEGIIIFDQDDLFDASYIYFPSDLMNQQ